MARPATHHEATRDRLLSLATDAVIEGGASSLQVADVAAAAGMTAPAVYRYFRDRDDLLRATLRRQVEAFAEEVTAGARRGPTPAERTATFLADQAAYLERTDAGAVRVVLEAVLDAGADPDLATEVAPAVEALRSLATDDEDDEDGEDGDVEDGDVEGDVGSTDALSAQLLAAACAGIQFLHAAGLLEVPPRALYERLLELLAAASRSN